MDNRNHFSTGSSTPLYRQFMDYVKRRKIMKMVIFERIL